MINYLKTIRKTIYAILLIGNSSICLYAQPGTDPFKGFKIMQVPRTGIPIGAIWSNSGPIGNGVGQQDLSVSDSYAAVNSTTGKNFVINLKVTFLTSLGINAGVSSSNSSSIEMDDFKIVRLNSIEVLKQNIGNEILYEGLLAGKISITTDKSNAADLKLNFTKISKNIELNEETQADNKVKFTANGTNLFLAYRVIALSSQKQSKKKVKLRSQSASGSHSAKLSSTQSANVKNYSITICPCNVIACAAEKRKEYNEMTNDRAMNILNSCAQTETWMIKALDKNQISNGAPKEILHRDKLPFDIWNKNYALSYKLTSNGFLIDYLNIEHLYIEAIAMNTGGYLVWKGKDDRVSLVSQEIKFENKIPSGVSGW